jgi:hypothetical protein
MWPYMALMGGWMALWWVAGIEVTSTASRSCGGDPGL